MTVRLRELAHSRTGDKGDTSNISLIAYRREDFPWLEREVCAERVRNHFNAICKGEVLRYTLPQLGAMNFVLHQTLGGGVTRSLALDAHGKTLSSLLLDMEIEVPSLTLAQALRNERP